MNFSRRYFFQAVAGAGGLAALRAQVAGPSTPPLNGLSKRQSRGWVEDHFADPRKMAPGSIMPPYKLAPKDLENLTSYLFALPD